MSQMSVLSSLKELVEQEQYQQAIEVVATLDPPRMDAQEAALFSEIVSQIPEAAIEQNAGACMCLSLLAHRLGQPAKAQQWHSSIINLRAQEEEGNERWVELSALINRNLLAFPANNNAKLLLLFAVIDNEAKSYRVTMPQICPTGCRPSVLNGTVDLSELGKNGPSIAGIVAPMLDCLTSGQGQAFVSLAMCEIYYEKDQLDMASIEVAKTVSEKNPEILLATYHMLCKQGLLDKKAHQSETLLPRLEEILVQANADHLMPNFRAMKAVFALYRGDVASAQQWLEEYAPDELKNYDAWDTYQMLVKARVYIATERYRDALTLLESLLKHALDCRRPLDAMQALVHSAIACKQMNADEIAMQKFVQAVEIGQKYGYVRVFADAGEQVVPLVQACLSQEGYSVLARKYLEKILKASQEYARLVPHLYAKEKQEPEQPTVQLTAKELKILGLLEEGKSNNEICTVLKIKLPTVKFHVANIFEKLDANNRVTAINKGKALHLI